MEDLEKKFRDEFQKQNEFNEFNFYLKYFRDNISELHEHIWRGKGDCSQTIIKSFDEAISFFRGQKPEHWKEIDLDRSFSNLVSDMLNQEDNKDNEVHKLLLENIKAFEISNAPKINNKYGKAFYRAGWRYETVLFTFFMLTRKYDSLLFPYLSEFEIEDNEKNTKDFIAVKAHILQLKS